MLATPVPEDFLKAMASYGRREFDALPGALETEPEVGVRLNMLKVNAAPEGAKRVAWCDSGYHLASRPAFTFDPLLHQGGYYVQDPSSMFIASIAAEIARQNGDKPLTWLDACAAPGGKTTAAIGSLPWGSVVVANEFVGTRAAILRENLAKWGYPFVKVTQGDTSRFSRIGAAFDVVAADVPCSGEGMMRKDDDARRQWSPKLVAECAALQRQIVANVWPALKPGGYLIYSTCTLNPTENEENVAWIMREFGAENPPISVDPEWNISPALTADVNALRFTPGHTRGEGLFVALLQKPVDAPAKPLSFKQPRNLKTVAHPWLSEEIRIAERKDPDGTLTAVIPAAGLPEELWPGLTLGIAKGRDMLPSQQLALSAIYRRGAFPEAEVDRPTALTYLRREAISLPAATPRDIVLLTYAGLPLGFVKNLGNRANNLYPQPWRILSALPSPLPSTAL